MKTDDNKMVLFGAGKIGRSFIGQLFSRSGYKIIFVDVYKPVIDALNSSGQYKVVIKGDHEQEIIIKNVEGILASETEKVAMALADASICAVSVGQQGLQSLIPVIAKGLCLRYNLYPNNPLDIIIAENMRNADIWFRENLIKNLPPDYPFDRLVGLVETSIGKMVPIMSAEDTKNDPLLVYAEAYNNLILDKKAFKNPIPYVNGLAPKENMKAWVDRKLFIHNLGHAVAAYHSYSINPSLIYMYEGLAIPEVWESTRQAMQESSLILMSLYPDEFTQNHLNEHIDDLLRRFQNKALGDTIHRVGCDLPRKLSPTDRLVAPIKEAIRYNLPYKYINRALHLAFNFKAVDQNGNMHPEDIRFHQLLNENGKDWILRNICRFSSEEIEELSKL